MIDISDGLGLDLHRLCLASGVGVVLEDLPVAHGATEEEALAGGDDYELCFSAPSIDEVMAAFSSAGLAPPICIGEATSEKELRMLRGAEFKPGGYTHDLA
jgi:thiamine-monophosphate kinase